MSRFTGIAAAVCALVALGSSSASAQIIYEPVQYQYQASQFYYYGGSDPRVHEYAASPVGGAGRWGRVNGYAFVSGDIHRHREVVSEPVRVFNDAFPYINVHKYGFTVTDARNEAYSNVPHYFRKVDLLNAAIPVDRAFVVPAQAQPIRIDRQTIRWTRPGGATTAPRPLMIIPRPKPQPKPSDSTLALAR
jgi:hypothetical protein